MKRRRSVSSVGIALLLSLALAGQALAAVAWSTPKVAGGNYSWNGGYALARTGISPLYLHAIYATDFVGGVFASDAGP